MMPAWSSNIALTGARPRVNPVHLTVFLSVLMLAFYYGISQSTAAAPPPTASSYFGKATTVSALMEGVGRFIEGSMLVGVGIANKLLPDAGSLLIAISGTMLAWYAITWILGGSLEDIIGSFIKFVLLWGLAKYALDNYGTFVGAIGDGFTYAMSTLGVDVNNYVSSLFALGTKTFSGVNEALGGLGTGWSITQWLVAGVGWLMAFILSVIIFIVGTVIAAFIAVSQMMMGIGVALGPLLVPFLLLPPLSGLAMGWLNFMIYAGFVKLVGAVMIVFLADMLGAVTSLSFVTQVDGEVSFQWFVYLSAIVIVILSAVMSMFIMEIASGLVGGSPLRGILQAGSKTVGGQMNQAKAGGRAILDRFKKAPAK